MPPFNSFSSFSMQASTFEPFEPRAETETTTLFGVEGATDPVMNVLMSLDTTTQQPDMTTTSSPLDTTTQQRDMTTTSSPLETTTQQPDPTTTTSPHNSRIRTNLKALRERLSKLKENSLNSMETRVFGLKDDAIANMAKFEPLKKFKNTRNPGKSVEEKIQIVYANQTFIGKELRARKMQKFIKKMKEDKARNSDPKLEIFKSKDLILTDFTVPVRWGGALRKSL